MSRRCSCILLLVVITGCGGSTPARQATSTAAADTNVTRSVPLPKLSITVDGGYAFVHEPVGKRVHFASLPFPGMPEEHLHHPLKLRLEKGDFLLQESSVPPTVISLPSLRLGWDLTGYRVSLLGSAPGDIEVPAADPQTVGCEGSNQPLNNLAYLPPIAELAGPRTALVPSWLGRVTGALTLSGGKVSVTQLAPGCVDFSAQPTGTTIVHSQRIASGHGGVSYVVDLPNGDATLEFHTMDGRRVGKAVFRAGTEGLSFALSPHHPQPPGEARTTADPHFRQFFSLLESTQAITPLYSIWPKKLGANEFAKVTPREGCPIGRYTLP